MTRIATIGSALKGAYYDSFTNTDAMARAVKKALGAESDQLNAHAIEQRICRHLAEHDPADFRALAEEIAAMLPEADADGWIQWHGGGCPVPPDTMVEVRLRYGEVNKERADWYQWGHDGCDGDIVAYRIVKPAPKQEQPVDEKLTIECLFECFANWSDARQIGDQEGMKKAAAEAQRFLDGMGGESEAQELKDRLEFTERGEQAADAEVERLQGLAKELAGALEDMRVAFGNSIPHPAMAETAESVLSRALAVLAKAKAAGLV